MLGHGRQQKSQKKSKKKKKTKKKEKKDQQGSVGHGTRARSMSFGSTDDIPGSDNSRAVPLVDDTIARLCHQTHEHPALNW